MREAVKLLYSVNLSGTRCGENAAWDILIRSRAMSFAYTRIQDQDRDRSRKSSTVFGPKAAAYSDTAGAIAISSPSLVTPP